MSQWGLNAKIIMKIIFHAIILMFSLSLLTAWGKVSERTGLNDYRRQGLDFSAEAGVVDLLTNILVADPQKAYLIIEATIPDKESNQPNRIYLNRGSYPIDIPAHSDIVAVDPGRYRISGILFQEDEYYGEGSLTIKGENVFNVSEGRIYWIGNLVLHKTSAPAENSDPMYTINLVNDIQILKRACERSPQVFEAFPVNTFGKSSEFKLDCSK